MPRAFYARPTVQVARALLGKVLVHDTPDGQRRAGRIVETEAYLGPEDAASHARFGPHGRSAVMYGQAGRAYVYLIYGVYHCFNAVAEGEGVPGAVLVRAVEGLEDAADERSSGPGLTCRALRIDRQCSGLDLTTSPLRIEDHPDVEDAAVMMGPRVGVSYAGTWATRPWRFWLPTSSRVSRPHGGTPFARQVLDTP